MKMAKIGILLTNIGTPISNEPNDVGNYLSEFLMDPYVVDIPKILRWILVKFLIVPRRKYASSEAYKKVWTAQGSPLLVNSKALALELAHQLGADYSVKIGMRYSQPSIQDAISLFAAEEIKKLVIVPMYPQFADSSSTSSLEKAVEEVKSQGLDLPIISIQSFYDDPGFIEAYVKVIREGTALGQPDHYLFSYHGLPERQIQRLHPGHCLKSSNCCDQITEANKNCYRAQCVSTTNALIKSLGLRSDQYSFSFQSRLGRTKWIDPYTDKVLPELVKKGVRRLAVVCPSFVADCLETLEEIGIRGRDEFIEAGGEELILIPCLNASVSWAESLAKMIQVAQ
jgi:ferrochelatase